MTRFSDRLLDAFYYSPELRNYIKLLREKQDEGIISLSKGRDFIDKIVKPMTNKEIQESKDDIYSYIEITDITDSGSIVSMRKEVFQDLPTRARLKVNKNDVCFAKNISSRGTTLIIPEKLDGQLVTTGFICIRPRDFEEALLLWAILRSEFFAKQIYYLGITAVQPEVREEIFIDDMIIPVPNNPKDKMKIINNAKKVWELQKNLNDATYDIEILTDKLFKNS